MLAQVGASIKDYNTTGLKREGAARTRADWLFDTIGQLCIVVTQWAWTRDVEIAFDNMGLGQRDAMKDYNKVQIEMMNDLIFLVQGELAKLTRRTAMNLITMETHSRDIVISMIEDEFDVKDCFKWMGQMKTRFERRASSSSGGAEDDIFIDICDASFQYSFEYLGNPGRLVITPLTDRIYITATQASHLNLGCAPAGPAGTGKTESTKDLSAALGKAVYVFNCGPEMDYRTMGDIFKGLGSSGTWGCFDEFNRLLPEVLSVCSVQYKAVLDGQLQGRQVHLRRRRVLAPPARLHVVHHDEPRLPRPRRAARVAQGALPPRDRHGARLPHDHGEHADGRGLHRRARALAQVLHALQALGRPARRQPVAARQAAALRLGPARHRLGAQGRGHLPARREEPRGRARGGPAHARAARLQPAQDLGRRPCRLHGPDEGPLPRRLRQDAQGARRRL